MIFHVTIPGYYQTIDIKPRYPFASAAAKEVAEMLGIRDDHEAVVVDPDGIESRWLVSHTDLYYARPIE